MSTSATIRLVSYADILCAVNVQELLDEYAAECSIPEIRQANPQADTYAALENSGVMKCFGMYVEAELVGFASVLIYVAPHCGEKLASIESLFVFKARRSHVSGLDLMTAVERFAQEEGCKGILYTASINGQLESLLSMRQGCAAIKTVFYKGLN